MRKIVPVILAVFLSLSVSVLAGAASLNEIQFIKIAPQDAKAVIKGADGKLVVVKPGDAIADGITVKEIVTGRIGLEEKTDQGLETVFVRMVNGKSTIERVRKLPENMPLLVAPPANDK